LICAPAAAESWHVKGHTLKVKAVHVVFLVNELY